jgi:hypothetical protein
MADAAVISLAIKEIAFKYIKGVHASFMEKDPATFPASSLEYQRRRAQVEFDKYMGATTAVIAATTDRAAKDALLIEMNEVDTMLAEIFVWATPPNRAQSTESERSVVVSQGKPKRAPENMSNFDGSHSKWPAFRDLFKALVIDAEYSELECFLLLRKHCKGASEEVIAGYAPVAASFAMAWESLKDIFEDSYSIIQSLVDKLIELAPAKSKSVIEMRRVIDTFRSTIRQLEGMGLDTLGWDAFLVNLLARKMPIGTVHDWEQQRDKNELPTLADFMTFLDGKARLRVFASEYQGGYNRRQQSQGATNGNTGAGVNSQNTNQNPFALRPSNTQQGQGNAMQGNAQHGQGNENRRPTFTTKGGPRVCFQCKGDHYIFACPDVVNLDLKAKDAIIHKLGVCKNCLRQGHAANACEREGCRECAGVKHNRLLCPKPRGPKRGAPQVNHVAEKKARGGE